MTKIEIVTVVLWVVLLCAVEVARTQSEIRVKPQPLQVITPHYNTRRLPNGQTQIVAAIEPHSVHIHKEAEDRQLNRLKLLKKRKRKFRFFQKEITKCGLPFKFILKKSDDGGDDEDEIRVKIPYGFGNEYFPNAQRKNGNFTETDDTNDNESDDEEDENEDVQPKIRFRANQQVSNNFRPIMRYKIPPFKPIRGPIPMFGMSRMISRKPWLKPTPWRLARPGVAPFPYRLMEPIPGMVGGTPPIPNLQTKKEKHIPLSTTPIPVLQKDLVSNFGGKFRNYWPEQRLKVVDDDTKNQVTYKNPSSYNTKYRQSDYSMPGIYHETTTSPPVNQNKDNEQVVIVTPSAIWPLNSPVFHEKGRNVKQDKNTDKWVPILDNDNNFQISVESEPEIITSQYPMSEEKLSENVVTFSSKVPIKITDKSEDRWLSQIPDNNSARTKRSWIESLSTLVSGSMTVKED